MGCMMETYGSFFDGYYYQNIRAWLCPSAAWVWKALLWFLRADSAVGTMSSGREAALGPGQLLVGARGLCGSSPDRESRAVRSEDTAEEKAQKHVYEQMEDSLRRARHGSTSRNPWQGDTYLRWPINVVFLEVSVEVEVSQDEPVCAEANVILQRGRTPPCCWRWRWRVWTVPSCEKILLPNFCSRGHILLNARHTWISAFSRLASCPVLNKSEMRQKEACEVNKSIR